MLASTLQASSQCWIGILNISSEHYLRRNPERGREAAAPSNIKEIQEIQGGQEAPHDGDAFNPKDA